MNKKTIWVLIILFFFILGLVVLLSMVYSFFRPEKVEVANNAYLEIKLDGRLDDYNAGPQLTDFFQGKIMSLYDTWLNLKKASRDPRIKAVVLRFGLLEADWAKMNELREAILEFRKSGKPAIAYFEEAPDADQEYYLASACDKIIIHPLGWLGLNGLAAEIPFFKGTLDKLGIKAEFEHIEKYKTAYNQFTETGFTPEHKEMMESIYRDFFETYLNTISSAREVTPEKMKELIDRGSFQAQEALKAGLVDGLAYEDNLFAEAGYKKLPELTKITNEKYASLNPEVFGLNRGQKLALIFASGAIINGEGQMVALGSETFTRWIRKAAADRSVAAIVVRVDSPGGSALGSDVIWHEMLMARKEKPVVVSMSGLAGSGGYWISLAGNSIIAQPQTLTGSIGVISGKFSFAGLMQKLGIKTEKIVFGKEADAYSIYREFTPEERAALKNQIRIIYQQFLERVATARNLPVEEVDRIGQGRVWTGHQALELKLVDQLGGLDTAINVAKKLAGIPAEQEVRLVVWPKKRKLFDLFLGKQTELQELIYYSELMNVYSRIIRVLAQPAVWSLMPIFRY